MESAKEPVMVLPFTGDLMNRLQLIVRYGMRAGQARLGMGM